MLDQPPPAVEAVAPAPVPEDLRLMLEAAIADGDAKVIGRMFDYAAQVRPDAAAGIAAMRAAHESRLAERKAQTAAEAQARLATAGLFDNWEGKLEFGATRTTGTVSSLGVLASAELDKTGVDWSHKVLLRGEVQDAERVRAVERILASWQPRYAVEDDSYVFGLGQFERDPALGYQQRYSLGLGAGWTLTRGDGFKLAVEGGPALRHTQFRLEDRTRLAGRGTADLRWALSDRLDFTQRLSLFYEDGTSSGLIASAIDSKVSENLNLRLSYEYRIEEDLMRGISASGSISRASIVYRLR